jgi:diacylglycerol kinase
MKPTYESEKFLLAINSIIFAIKTEIHFKFHLIATGVTLMMAYLFNISSIEWIMLIIIIFVVLITEMVNTAIETIINLITSDYHPLAKTGKDIASGAVLLSSIMATIVGTLIFYPKVSTVLQRWLLLGQ